MSKYGDELPVGDEQMKLSLDFPLKPLTFRYRPHSVISTVLMVTLEERNPEPHVSGPFGPSCLTDSQNIGRISIRLSEE